ncbi:MAG: AI-2E family transporter [Erysipelotrichaceae bacterium]|nr:AI-2E family transporter [Erysipelotrichaceae bacterium]
MKWKERIRNSSWYSTAVALCIAVVLYVFLTHLATVKHILGVLIGFIKPVITALIIAYVLDPIVRFFERLFNKKLKSPTASRNIATLITFVMVIIIMVIIAYELIPQLANSVMTFLGNLDSYNASFEAWLRTLDFMTPEHVTSIMEHLNRLRNIAETLGTVIVNNATDVLHVSFNIGSMIINGFISFILAMYMLTYKNKQLASFEKMFRVVMSDEAYGNFTTFIMKCNYILIRFISCDLLDGLIVGVANAVFMTIMGMSYVPLISVIVGVTNLAPTFGPFVGGFVGASILLLVNPMHALIFLIFTLSLQQVDGYVIKPLLFADAFEIPSMWVLISIVVGGRMFGVWGIILGIPTAAIIDFTYQEIIYPQLERRKEKMLAKQENIEP